VTQISYSVNSLCVNMVTFALLVSNLAFRIDGDDERWLFLFSEERKRLS